MKTEQVTKVWEFYRDTTDSYKEPMRKQLRKLDEHVDHIEAENAKLRELCAALYGFAYDEYPDGAELNFSDRMRELGIEVDA